MTIRGARLGMMLVWSMLVAALVGLICASPALAYEKPRLTCSRTCAYVGAVPKLTLTIPASLLSAPHGRVAAVLVKYRMERGAWRVASTTSLSDHVTGAVITTYLRPQRGRYRYVARVISGAGRFDSDPVELAIVGRNVVALTFDDGPWPRFTDSIRTTLKMKDARATFFMCGYSLAAYPAIGRAVAADGQEVGNHSYTHANLASLSSYAIGRELGRTQDLVKRLLGATPRVCRPPYGSTSARVRSVIEAAGMRQILWDVDPEDWRRPGASAVVSRVVSRVRPGYVVLMHDGGGDRSGTAAALPVIIDRLRREGDYDFVTVSELAALKAGR